MASQQVNAAYNSMSRIYANCLAFLSGLKCVWHLKHVRMFAAQPINKLCITSLSSNALRKAFLTYSPQKQDDILLILAIRGCCNFESRKAAQYPLWFSTIVIEHVGMDR